MKIVCDSCGAKYSIADEKVAGKIFKIRCKKCSAVLEVQGPQPSAPPAEDPATEVYDARAEAVWYVVIEGDQQGPLAPVQMMGLFAKGSIGLDSYVWREGFDDWKVAGDVPDLVHLLGDESAGETTPQASDDTSAIGAGGDLFGDSNGDSGPQPQPASNIFAAFDSGPIANGDPAPPAGGSQPQVATSANGNGMTGAAPQRMTGHRNENSVLFSLGNLQQLAAREPASGTRTEGVAPQSATAPRSGRAAGEGSGLIDIRALAQSTSSGTQDAAPETPDDLLGLGATAGVGRGGMLGGPLLGPAPTEKEGRNRWLTIGGASLAVVLVIALGVGIGFAFKGSTEDSGFEVSAPAGETGSPARIAQAPGEPPEASPSLAVPSDPEMVEDEELEDVEELPPAPTIDDSQPSPPATTAKRRDRRRRRAAKRTTSAPAAAAAAPAPKKRSGNLDALMDEVIGESPSSSARRQAKSSGGATGSKLPNSPSRADVKRALSGVSGAVRRCKKDKSGTALVNVTFSGKTGRATSANVVSGPFKGTGVGGCVERAVKRARVSRFKQSTFNVKFPYRL